MGWCGGCRKSEVRKKTYSDPAFQVHFVDTGHFAIETHGAEIAARMLEFLDRSIER